MNELQFLKLGGSLITDKNISHYARLDVIQRLAVEILQVLQINPGLKLLIGHGSGSFGHFPAQKYRTREGVNTPEEWRGFAEVWREAKALNTIVMQTLTEVGIPAIAFAPSSSVITRDHNIIEWNSSQIKTALESQLVPVIYGDVVFDQLLGGTILSTEDQFEYLAKELAPQRILLAGIEPGVWKSFPERKDIYTNITPSTFIEVETHLAKSESPDVTGGMRSKVHSMMNLIQSNYCQEVLIFSGVEPGSVENAISGKYPGTRITLD